MIIVLMGYMGSGKSTLGKALAEVLNFDFLDLDQYIAAKESASISDIFEHNGELYFRKKETEYLKDILHSKIQCVLALGGGTPCYGNNLNLLLNRAHVKTVYIKLSIPILAERLLSEQQSRPLITHVSTNADMLEFIGKHLFERSYYYNQAHYILNADHKSNRVLVNTLLKNLI